LLRGKAMVRLFEYDLTLLTANRAKVPRKSRKKLRDLKENLIVNTQHEEDDGSKVPSVKKTTGVQGWLPRLL
jgi:hypothetical protein